MSQAPVTGTTTLPSTGDVIDGKYVLERLLGRGGMGAVYAARHRKLGHAVAIKVMLADAANHEAASRFVNEGRAAANIQNEHVVRVSDVDEENGYAYMVLELLEGEDLAQVLERERRLPAAVAVSYAIQALAGVRQAHAQGIVHRDLKPSNLFLAKRNDGTAVIKVLDFGISKANSANPLGAAPGALTSTKAMLGSPLYMSPEQLRSSKSVDARADIWAMGVIIYELCTGKLPFMGDNLGELFAQILEVEAPPLRQLAPDAPPQLETIVAKCLQRRPEHRFQTALELERELHPLAQSVGAATIPTYGSAQSPAAHTAMMTTPQNGYVQSQPSYDPRIGPGTPPNQMQMTPQGGMMGPPGNYGPPPQRMGPGSTTGSGVHPPVVKGTAPLGSVTPQPNALTDGSWQSTGSASGVPSKTSTTLVMVAVFGLLVVVGLGVAGYSIANKGKSNAGGSSSASASVFTTQVTAPPLPPTSEPSSTAAVPATAAASASASSAPAVTSTDKPVVPVVPVVPHSNPNVGRPRPPEPPPPRPPQDPPVKPPPPASKDPNVQQNSR